MKKNQVVKKDEIITSSYEDNMKLDENKEVVLRRPSIDMPLSMQECALSFTQSFLDDLHIKSTRLNPSQLAYALKKEFDKRYGAVWHCIVGKSYGSYVTHSPAGFLYFSFDSYFVLLFKTQVHVITPTSLPNDS